MKEIQLVHKIINWINQHENAHARKQHGGMYGTIGEPDITGCVNGRRIEIEVKLPGNEPTKIQLHRMKEWERCGALTGVAHSLEEAQIILKDLIPCESSTK